MASKHCPVELSEANKNIRPSIWVESVNLVTKYKALNLGQGFPDFADVVPKRLKAALIATQSPESPVTNNQYTRGQGNTAFVQAIADFYSPFYGRDLDPMKEVLVTVGAYEGLHCAINAVTNPGDEVILIEPYFDSYAETLRNLGAIIRYIPLRLKEGSTSSSDFILDRDELAGIFNEKTKAIVVNTPHNPTGKVFTRDEIEFIGSLCKKYNSLYISDEVYEWIVYEGAQHVRAASLPDMWERTVTVCSAGKTFNVTGWKTGWVIGPEYLISAAMRVHQGIIYTCPTPLQLALAETFKQEKPLLNTSDSYWHWLNKDLTAKRERFFNMAKEAGLNPILPEGGYFMLVDVRELETRLEKEKDVFLDVATQRWLIKEKGVAVIPTSVFFGEEHKQEFNHYIRLCFIKGEETITHAERIFKALKN